jgi:hypothetical protein
MDEKCRNSFVMDSKFDGFKAKWIHQIKYFEYKAFPSRNDAPKSHIVVTHGSTFKLWHEFVHSSMILL